MSPGLSVDVGIVTDRREEMVRFYTRVLELEHVTTIDSMLGPMEVLAFGCSRIKIVSPGHSMPPPVDGCSGGIRYLTFETHDLDALWERVAASGVHVVAAPAPASSATGLVAMLRDPDGNLIEIVQRHLISPQTREGRA
jgi:predicted enzyme related to lactoylglutathione lyase